MADNEDRHVFVSYVRENSDEVDALCEVLSAAGIPYWSDRTKLGPGDDWKRKIREAIQSGSLAFLACFSPESIARATSTMNEELTLAVEEFRKRPPGATWLIPVRLADVDVPTWDLGAGRTLNDLNYSDLFGPKYLAETHKLVATINAIFGRAGGDDVSSQAALEETDVTRRTESMIRLTKQWVGDPAARIRLDDMIRHETSSIIETATATTGVSLPGGPEGLATIVDSALQLAEITKPLCASIQVGACWSTEPNFDPWATSVQRLSALAHEVVGGIVAMRDLRHVPALCAIFTGAMAAIGKRRWDVLKSFVIDTTIRDQYQGSLQLIDAEHYWQAFRNSPEIAQIVGMAAKNATDGMTTVHAYQSSKPPEQYTPVATWMFGFLRSTFADQCPDDAAYIELFDRTEVMLGVLSHDQARQRFDQSKPYASGSNWFGRSTWRFGNMLADPVGDLRKEITAAGSSWGPLQAGLFGGDLSRALNAIDGYEPDFQQLARRRA